MAFSCSFNQLLKARSRMNPQTISPKVQREYNSVVSRLKLLVKRCSNQQATQGRRNLQGRGDCSPTILLKVSLHQKCLWIILNIHQSIVKIYNFFFCHTVFTFFRKVLLSFCVTGSQPSQCVALCAGKFRFQFFCWMFRIILQGFYR